MCGCNYNAKDVMNTIFSIDNFCIEFWLVRVKKFWYLSKYSLSPAINGLSGSEDQPWHSGPSCLLGSGLVTLALAL